MTTVLFEIGLWIVVGVGSLLAGDIFVRLIESVLGDAELVVLVVSVVGGAATFTLADDPMWPFAVGLAVCSALTSIGCTSGLATNAVDTVLDTLGALRTRITR